MLASERDIVITCLTIFASVDSLFLDFSGTNVLLAKIARC